MSENQASQTALSPFEPLDAVIAELATVRTDIAKLSIREQELLRMLTQCRDNLDAVIQQERPAATPPISALDALLRSSIDVLRLSVRIANALCAEKIFLVGDLVTRKEGKIPYLGYKSLTKIKEVLMVHDLSLGMTLQNWPPKE